MNQDSLSASKENPNKLHFSNNSNFIFGDEDRSRSLFLNNQYLSTFLEFTNRFKEENNHEKKITTNFQHPEQSLNHINSNSDKKIPEECAKNRPQNVPRSEPRYVNSAQYHRMMIMRIKRAQREIKMQAELEKIKEQMRLNGDEKKKYKYESRHLHAKNRQRGPDGKFVKKQSENLNKQVKIEESFKENLLKQEHLETKSPKKKISKNK